jgi:probable HAF family extracellular repeat protein
MSKLKLLSCLPLLLISSANSVAQMSYTTTDLGTLGGASSYAYRMSDAGQVVGQADTATESHAFLYDSTHGMVDLGTLGGTFSMANGIRGNYVVGHSTIAGDANTHAFVYNLQTLAMQDIHTLIGATGGDSSAISLNSSGLVVGAMVMADGTTHAFLYNIATGAHTDLHPLLAMGGSYDTAYDINDAGQIVGSAGNDALAGYAGFMYDTNTAKVTSLASLSGDSSAAIINSSAQVVGAVRNSSNAVRAVLWKNAAMADLGDLGGGFANAESININGIVVGESSISGGSAFAFRWDASQRYGKPEHPELLSGDATVSGQRHQWFEPDRWLWIHWQFHPRISSGPSGAKRYPHSDFRSESFVCGSVRNALGVGLRGWGDADWVGSLQGRDRGLGDGHIDRWKSRSHHDVSEEWNLVNRG